MDTSLGDMGFHQQHQCGVAPDGTDPADPVEEESSSQEARLYSDINQYCELEMNSSELLDVKFPLEDVTAGHVAVLGQSQETQTLKSISDLLKSSVSLRNSEISLYISFPNLR